MPPVARENIPRLTYAPSQTHRPPRNNKKTPAGRYSQYSANSSIISQPAPKSRAHRPATEEDRELHKIPTDYILDQWDPNEKPIGFKGNVFDTNSLGKWIFDWAAWSYGGKKSPMAAIAGDLWLLLIQLSGKLRLSDEFLHSSTRETLGNFDEADMVRDFIESGTRLMERLQGFLTRCEKPVEEALDEKTHLGELLVYIMFDRRNHLPQTERFIQDIRLWNFRWDANCAEVVGEERAMTGRH